MVSSVGHLIVRHPCNNNARFLKPVFRAVRLGGVSIAGAATVQRLRHPRAGSALPEPPAWKSRAGI